MGWQSAWEGQEDDKEGLAGHDARAVGAVVDPGIGSGRRTARRKEWSWYIVSCGPMRKIDLPCKTRQS